MTGLALTTDPSVVEWECDQDGFYFIKMWGAGGPGSGGFSGTKGGGGGGGGAFAGVYQYLYDGTTYTFQIAEATAGGAFPEGLGARPGPSIWGDTLVAVSGNPGNGNTAALGGNGGECRGDITASGLPGQIRLGGQAGSFIGAPGGSGSYGGGSGGISSGIGSVVAANPEAPGGGGSGGGAQNAAGHPGANGGIEILLIPDDSNPGYKFFGVDADFSYPGESSTLVQTFPEDGQAIVECTGAGGGGRGANGSFGGFGGGGGATSCQLVKIYSGVLYTVRAALGGTGSLYGTNTSTDGGDSYFTPTPLRANKKSIGAGVGKLWLAHPSTDTAQKHGFDVGQSVVITGVDANFNGTKTITAIDRVNHTISFSMVGSVSETSFAAAGSIGVAGTYLVMAKGGKRATNAGSSTTLTTPGGLASESIGKTEWKWDGENGLPASATAPGNAGMGGASGGPTDGLGGLGGGTGLFGTGTNGNDGETGALPGGGGGGGKGVFGGDGGKGGDGAVAIRYVKSLMKINQDGEVRLITRVRVNLPSPTGVKDLDPKIIRPKISNPALKDKFSSAKMQVSPLSMRRQKPAYLSALTPPGAEALFNSEIGGFNLRSGAKNTLEAVKAGNMRYCVYGDSVSEGWTEYSLLIGIGSLQNFPKAFPRWARNFMAGVSDIPGTGPNVSKIGGSGLTIPVRDDAFVRTGAAWQTGGHFLWSAAAGSIITYTSYVPGDSVEIVTSGASFLVTIDGAVKTPTAATAGNGTLLRTTYEGLSYGNHVVRIQPAAAVRANLFAVGTYKADGSGIIVDNLSQGGATAAYRPSQTNPPYQNVWSDLNAAPDGQIKTWTRYDEIYGPGRHPHMAVIFLGGNDTFAGISAADIAAAFEIIGDQIKAASPDMEILIMPDAHTADRVQALMQLCYDKDWAMLDFFWLAKKLRSIFGGGHNGDQFGHQSADVGAPWIGQMLADALLLG